MPPKSKSGKGGGKGNGKPRANNNNRRNNNNTRTNNGNNGNGTRRSNNNKGTLYPDHTPVEECLKKYISTAAADKNIARGKIRTMAGGKRAFLNCDKGFYGRDILLDGELGRNRALDGDLVFVEILGPVGENGSARGGGTSNEDTKVVTVDADADDLAMDELNLDNHNDEVYDMETDEDRDNDEEEMWQNDETQRTLWDPVVKIKKRSNMNNNNNNNGTNGTGNTGGLNQEDEEQFQGRVICIIAPKVSGASEINPTTGTRTSTESSKPRRTIVGTIARASANNNRILFLPNSKTLPRFMAPPNTVLPSNTKNPQAPAQLYKADYIYGTWSTTDKWAPCTNLKKMGQSCNIEDETAALLLEFDVDHGEFGPGVLKDVENSVQSGRFQQKDSQELGWKPTEDMLRGRRDYRQERIFTIDPTTAKDLDDALHINELEDGRIEIGVHIADVSHFVTHESNVDVEAARRTTTVYLVDRVIPMLPKPLCEIACSLNENVERLAFSCVWTMNRDGTLAKKKSKGNGKKSENDVWYGRTVIKSCARLDYATAQNIIDRKVATGESVDDVDETYWPKSRQPTGGHSIDDVAADVRLMHVVAMARRKLRFENGALALNGIKLTFQLDDSKAPNLCEPYPIRDSNRLIEEYMLMANYLVAQRLITHAGGLALLRQHMPPLDQGLQNVIEIAKNKGFEIDGSNSQTLQESLSRMGRDCDDKLFLQCVTELMMTPMRPAEYIACGEFEQVDWSHFALNIPYYTHFTSPIRRYPDVIVHRLLQATLDGPSAVQYYPQDQAEIQAICGHCNEKRMASKKAQERSDRIFLSIFLKTNPILSTLGVCVSVGDKAFTVYVPEIGINTLVYLDDHAELYEARVQKDKASGNRSMTLVPKHGSGRSRLDIQVFSKLSISCHCKEEPPIDVKLRIVGPWAE